MHSYTESLRYQMQGTNIEVKELAPPYVRTHLMGERQANDSHAMPLEDFIQEVFSILRETPNAPEILVKNVLPMRTAAFQGEKHYNEFYKQRNDMFLAARKAEWDKL